MALPRILNPSPPSSHEVISSARVSENLVILPVSPDPTPQLAPALENIPLHSPSRSDFEPFAESESTSATAHTPPILGVDPQIVEALKSKERLYVLKLGEQMESLINDRRTRLDLTPATSYQRLLVHRCSAYYKLTPETDSINKAITVFTTAESRIPARRFGELVPAESPVQPTFKIMRRSIADRSRSKPQSQAGSIAGEDGESSDVEPSEAGSAGGRSNATGSSKKHMTIAEREAAYNEARSRIFMDFEEKEKGKEKDFSASSSSASLTSGSVASSAGETSSAGDMEDSVGSPVTESEWSGPAVREKRDGHHSNGSSSRSLRSNAPTFGSSSSRGSRAPSPSSFKYPTLYEPPPGTTPSDPSQPRNPPYPYGDLYAYSPSRPTENTSYPYPYSCSPRNTERHGYTGAPRGHVFLPHQPPEGFFPYDPNCPPGQGLYHLPFCIASPQAFGPYPMPPPYVTPAVHLFSPPLASQNHGITPPEYSSGRSNHDVFSSAQTYPGLIGQQSMTAHNKPRGAPPARSAWSYGPGVGMGGFEVSNGNNRTGGGEVVGPRLSSSMRRVGNMTNTSNSNRASASDESSSTASSSTSSRRPFTSGSSQHPLPARPDWAVGLKPQPTLHSTHNRHHEHTMSPARNNGRFQQAPPLQSTDFPPLNPVTLIERRPPQAAGVWTNTSSARILIPGNNSPGSAIVNHPNGRTGIALNARPEESEGAWRPDTANSNSLAQQERGGDDRELRGDGVTPAILDKVTMLSVDDKDSTVTTAQPVAVVALAM